MRTIKFRALSIFKGEGWLYGIPSWDFTHLFPTDEDNLDGFSRFECFPETISQFTGLYDKNGTEIYENDILQLKIDGKEYNPLLVVYSEVYAGFCMLSENTLNNVIYKPHRPVNPNWWDVFKDEIEIIGNIYDNPELFKQ